MKFATLACLATLSWTTAVHAAEPSEQEYKTWHDSLTAGCAGKNAPHTEHFDVNNDGVADTMCWRTFTTTAYGDYVDLVAQVTTKAYGVQTGYILLPVNGGEEYAVCGPVDGLKVEQGTWTKEAFDELGWDYLGPLSIDLNGTDCDPPWLFWPADVRGPEVDLIFTRM